MNSSPSSSGADRAGSLSGREATGFPRKTRTRLVNICGRHKSRGGSRISYANTFVPFARSSCSVHIALLTGYMCIAARMFSWREPAHHHIIEIVCTLSQSRVISQLISNGCSEIHNRTLVTCNCNRLPLRCMRTKAIYFYVFVLSTLVSFLRL